MAFSIQSPAEQVASHLREEILTGRWKDEMPGVAHFKKELGVNSVTVNAALHLLEQQGLLVSQGRRRRRRIVEGPRKAAPSRFRFRILPYDRASCYAPHRLAILDGLHRAGFAAEFSRRTLEDLNMNPDQVARFVQKTNADAWIVSAGSREVLERFSEQPVPALALFGEFVHLPIAGVGVLKSTLMVDLVRDLVTRGHQRIVMLSHRDRIEPEARHYERKFLETLSTCGVETSKFHLPVWEPTCEGLHACLENLLRFSPPTALIVEEPEHLIAVRQYLSDRGIVVPRDVSLICGDTDPSFSWCKPAITHMTWDLQWVVGHAIRWAKQVASGAHDHRQRLFNARLSEGETIGPAPGS